MRVKDRSKRESQNPIFFFFFLFCQRLKGSEIKANRWGQRSIFAPRHLQDHQTHTKMGLIGTREIIYSTSFSETLVSTVTLNRDPPISYLRYGVKGHGQFCARASPPPNPNLSLTVVQPKSNLCPNPNPNPKHLYNVWGQRSSSSRTGFIQEPRTRVDQTGRSQKCFPLSALQPVLSLAQ